MRARTRAIRITIGRRSPLSAVSALNRLCFALQFKLCLKSANLILFIVSFNDLPPFRGFGDFCKKSKNNALDFVQANLIAATVVELGGARAGMGRYLLGVFNGAAVLQESRNARCAKGVTANFFR